MPDAISAVRPAVAPGIETTSMSLSTASFTTTHPGSEMIGSPASLIIATFKPFFIFSMIS